MAETKHTTVTKKRKRIDPLRKKKVIARERRRHPRFHLKLPMSYSRPKSDGNYGGIVGDASEGGILVQLPEKLNTGEVLKIEILFSRGWELKTVRGIAKIIWNDLAGRKRGKGNRSGLQFQLINKRNLQELRILLKEASRKNKNPNKN